MVLIAGEAGIGKTQLAEALREEAASLNRSDCIAHTRCYALEARLAYAPLADWLRSTALVPAVNGLNAVWRGELVRLLPELLIADRTLPAPQPIAERWQLKQMYEALLQAFVAA
jgi:predicted ATPase